MTSYIHKDCYNAPWEASFGQILTPLEDFIHKQTTAGKLLIASTLVALIIANSPLAHYYHDILDTHFTLQIGRWVLDHTLHHWINDGLMTLFFFTVGLEIKRELVAGDLSNLRAASLPLVAAIGGMLLPALIYYFVNTNPDASHGWGIPMATDIAFAVGILVMLGNRIPKALFTFLIALAIIDDLGAVTVIALFYTDIINLPYIGIAIVLVGAMVVLNLAGIRSPVPYFILGTVLWLDLSNSGVHATIAGIFTAWTVPTRPKIQPSVFREHVRNILKLMAEHKDEKNAITHKEEQRALIQAIESGIHKVESPLQRLEHALHAPVSLLILPVFALANAGITINPESLYAVFTESAPLGIILGLTLGKLLGIAGFSLIAIKLGLSSFPTDCNARHIIGIGLLGGIGFTMSIFITDLAFTSNSELIDISKLAVLVASTIAGLTGLLLLRSIPVKHGTT